MRSMERWVVGLLCTLSLLGISCGGPSPEMRMAIDRAVEGVYPALVRIHVVSTSASGGRMRKLRGSGSGTIISADGYVLTNHHVAGRATRLLCRLLWLHKTKVEPLLRLR